MKPVLIFPEKLGIQWHNCRIIKGCKHLERKNWGEEFPTPNRLTFVRFQFGQAVFQF
jgi:hypothetical protein